MENERVKELINKLESRCNSIVRDINECDKVYIHVSDIQGIINVLKHELDI
jgi:hypothetical protein